MAKMTPERAKNILARAETQSEEFGELVEKITYASRETKKLWREVYDNAMDERAHALLLFADLLSNVIGDVQAHFNHGKLLVQYLERMNKANQQLLELSRLIDDAASKDESIDAGALYEQLDAERGAQDI